MFITVKNLHYLYSDDPRRAVYHGAMAMEYFVLAAWLIQAAVGGTLFVSWLRGKRRAAPTVIPHVGAGLLGLVLWGVFLADGGVLAAWLAFAVITVGNGFGDAILLSRSRELRGPSTLRKGYVGAVADTFAGRMPRRVTFHAVFSGVVYFSCLGVCVGATVERLT